MNFFQRRKLLKQANYLEMIPIRQIQHISTSQNEHMSISANELITLLLPKFKNELVRKFFLSGRRSPFIHIKLDEFGSAAWLLIDGKLNVEQISEKLKDQFGDKILSPVEQLTKFLTKLYDNRYITYKQLQNPN